MNSNDKETLELIRDYKKSWSLLQKFDDGSLGLYKSDVGENFILGYNEASNIFGVQKADEFEGIIRIS